MSEIDQSIIPAIDAIDRTPLEAKDYTPYQRENYTPMTKGEGAVLGLVVAAVAGFIGFMIHNDWKLQKKREKEQAEREAARQQELDDFNAWVEEQKNNGKVVITTRLGEHIAIPVEAYNNIEVRRAPGRRF